MPRSSVSSVGILWGALAESGLVGILWGCRGKLCQPFHPRRTWRSKQVPITYGNYRLGCPRTQVCRRTPITRVSRVGFTDMRPRAQINSFGRGLCTPLGSAIGVPEGFPDLASDRANCQCEEDADSNFA